jgi:hypothetical protein
MSRWAVMLSLVALGATGDALAASPGFVAPEPPARAPSLIDDQSGHLSSAGADDSYVPTGRILADSGFRPWVDGFAFENYGNDLGPVNLTAAEMQQLFGPAVCISGAGDTCVLLPTMEHWMEDANAKMRSGHCLGFSVTALLMFRRALAQAPFGAASTPALQVVGNAPLQARIAESWAYQHLPSVYGALIESRPSRLLARLRKALRDPAGETYTIGITSPDGSGHALTPFAVEQAGKDRVNVLVYDSNYPAITRVVRFDTRRDSWSYAGGTGPGDGGHRYAGDARHRSMFLVPSSPGTRTQPCPSCGSFGARRRAAGHPATGTYDQISLTGDPSNHPHLVLTDRQGRRTGFLRGRLLDEIPGVAIIRHLAVENWRSAPEPTYRLPTGRHLRATIDGRDLAKSTEVDLTLITPHAHLMAAKIHVRPGQRDHLRFRAGSDAMEYISRVRRRAMSPEFNASVTEGEGEARTAYVFTVRTRGMRGRLDLALRNDRDSGYFAIDTRSTRRAHGNTADARLVLELRALGASGSDQLWRATVPMRRHETARWDYRVAPEPGRPVPVYVHKAGGGTDVVSATPVGH